MKKLIIISSLLMTFACSEDRVEQPEKELQQYSDINEYFDSKKQKEQEFIIDTSGNGPIVGNQKTKIWISKDILMYPNGDSVHWPYIVKLIELYTPKDMLYYQLPNVSGNKLLTSQGEIRVRAFKNNQELVLRPNRTWMVEMPNSQPQNGMSVYYEDSEPGDVDWQKSTLSFDTTEYGYKANISKLGWVQCAKPIDYSTKGIIFSYNSETDNLDNVPIFIYSSSLKSLVQVFEKTSIELPESINTETVIIGITSDKQLYQFNSKDIAVSSLNFDVIMTSTTDEKLTEILDKL